MVLTMTRASTRLAPAVLLAAALLCGGARAEPASGSDPIARFLAERGLADAAALVDPARARETLNRASDWAGGLVISALNFLGVPYKRGGSSAEQGFDCSGFTRHVFEASAGLLLPRRSDEQAKAPGLMAVDKAELKPGDLVFFNTLKRAFSHVGIYVGDGKFVHAPRSGASVRVEDMGSSYWAKRYNGARRAPEPVEVSAAARPLAQPAALPPLPAQTAAPATPAPAP